MVQEIQPPEEESRTMKEQRDALGNNSEEPSLCPAAQRARQEAEVRRLSCKETDSPPEYGGRGGLDPARYGDWEIKGLAYDF